MFKKRFKAGTAAPRTKTVLVPPPKEPDSPPEVVNKRPQLSAEQLLNRYEPQTKAVINEEWELEQLRKNGIEIHSETPDMELEHTIELLKGRIRAKIIDLEAQLRPDP